MPNKRFKTSQINAKPVVNPPKQKFTNNPSGFNPHYPGKAGSSSTPFDANGAQCIGDANFGEGAGTPGFMEGLPEDERYSEGNGKTNTHELPPPPRS